MVSRLTGSKDALPFRVGARQANKAKAPPTAKKISTMMKSPRVGSLAKACTEVIRPERTKSVPSSDMEKAAMASSRLQVRKAPLFSVARAECSSAVAISQGINEAFSTGSQAQKPPQPKT